MWSGCAITPVVCLDVKINPKISQTKSKAVSEDNGPLPLDKSGFRELSMVGIYRALGEEGG